jgi:hypothetical protein
MSDDRQARRDRRSNLRFSPRIAVDVPRETFAAALDRTGVDGDPEDVTPYESSPPVDAVEDALMEHFDPEFVWRVEGRERGED